MAITLQDEVYFGTTWYQLQANATDPAILLGGGFTNAQIIRDDTGKFFAAHVDKVDAAGHVTDVVLTFAGVETGQGAVEGESIGYNLPTAYALPGTVANQAAALYDQLLHDPRYANAALHVTGHSLGAGTAEYLAAVLSD